MARPSPSWPAGGRAGQRPRATGMDEKPRKKAHFSGEGPERLARPTGFEPVAFGSGGHVGNAQPPCCQLLAVK